MLATELMKHQKEALDFLSEKDSAGLFFEMGLGKTLVMLEHLARLQLRMAKPFPCLIVCPLSVVSVWAREVNKFGYPFKVIKLTGSFNERINKVNEVADIYVVNYEGLRLIPQHLKNKGFQTIILDESHRIKERTSQQTEIALALGQLIPRRYLLTGTPVTKSPEDVWTQLHWVKPLSLGNFFAFRGRYIDFRKFKVRAAGQMREIKKAYRFKNLKELEGRISEHCLRRTKAECLDLPKKVYKELHCEMSSDQQKNYFLLKTSLATMLADKQFRVETATALIQKLQQVCQGFIYDEDKKTHWFKNPGKLTILKDLLHDLPEEKIIIFAWFQADVERIAKDLTQDGYRVIVYEGNSEDRERIEQTFQNEEGQIIFLSQIERAKEGITLTAAAHVIYYGNSWSHGTRVQSEDRAHRKGQTKSVVYYDLIIPNTVDELVHDALKMKAGVADSITGDSIRLAKLLTA